MATTESPLLRLGILALDGCMLSSVASPIDALRVAEKVAQLRKPSLSPRFLTEVVSARGMKRPEFTGFTGELPKLTAEQVEAATNAVAPRPSPSWARRARSSSIRRRSPGPPPSCPKARAPGARWSARAG